MAPRKKVTPKRSSSRTIKTTQNKAKSKITGRKTGALKRGSDRNLKTEITLVDARAVLDRLVTE